MTLRLVRAAWSRLGRQPLSSPADDQGNGPDEQRFALGLRSVADLIAPAAVELAPDHVRLDRHYVRVWKVANYPRTVSPAWLEPLLRVGDAIDVSLHIYPLPTHQIMRSLAHRLAQLEAARLHDAHSGRVADAEREVAVEDIERLRDALQRGEQRIFSTGLYLLVRAPSKAALEAASRRLEIALASLLVQPRVALFEQDTGLRSCLPQAQDQLLAYRNLDTTSVATMLPFSASTISTDEGALYGVATRDHAPVILDPFDPVFENANHAIFARSGAGKSYFVKLLTLRQLVRGGHVMVIDPEDEYRRLCDAVGGQRLQLGAGSDSQLNPFDLPAGRAKGGGPNGNDDAPGAGEPDALAEQVAALASLCELMLAEPGGRLSARERAVLDQALYQTYECAGISRDPATHGRPAPLMRDLLHTLAGTEGEMATDLAARLARFVEGSAAGLFAGPTNVELDRPLTVFDVHALNAELRPVGIHLIATFVWGRVRQIRRPRLLVVDEAWSLLQHAEGGAFLAGLARRARKYYLGLITITQEAGDFLESEHGRTVLANAAIKLLMKQDGSTIEPVASAFRLSPEDRQLLLGAARGEGLLFARGAHIGLRVEASPKEHALATTAPWELAGMNPAVAFTPCEQPQGEVHHAA